MSQLLAQQIIIFHIPPLIKSKTAFSQLICLQIAIGRKSHSVRGLYYNLNILSSAGRAPEGSERYALCVFARNIDFFCLKTGMNFENA